MDTRDKTLEELQDISHFIQAGFLALVTVAQQIRDGERGSPSQGDVEESADLLRRASASLGREPE